MVAMARIKGIAIVQTVKMLRSQREAALAVLPPSLHHYLSKEISRSEWYPFDDHFGLLAALAKLMPPGGGDPWELFGRMGIRHDLSTLYRGMLVRGAGLQKSLQALRDLHHLYDDSGRWAVNGDDRRAVVDLFESVISPEYCRLRGGFMLEYLTMALGEVHQRKTLCRAKGDGFCRWELERG
jgi:hypothetical protein